MQAALNPRLLHGSMEWRLGSTLTSLFYLLIFTPVSQVLDCVKMRGSLIIITQMKG